MRRVWTPRRLCAFLLGLSACAMVSHAAPSASILDGRAQPEAASAIVAQDLWRGQAPVVAAANPLAAEAGAEVLRWGGCAVDAAIATQLVLGLVEPQSSGIGGGAFMLHFDGRETVAYDGRETAPQAADERLFLDSDGAPMPFWTAVVGGRAVGVPGVLQMLAMAHGEHGCLPWARLFEPAITLAERGFAVSPRLHTLLNADRYLRSDPDAAAYFYDAQGQAWPVGHLLRNPDLAQTLRAIAQHGTAAFYEGTLAQAIVDKVQTHPSNPGLLSLSDLRHYRAVRREALCVQHNAAQGPWRLCGMGPPSSGALAVGQILGILSALPPTTTAEAARAQPSADWLHAYLEASRLAFADRAQYVADPDFVPAPAGDWRSLLNPDYLAQRARLINLGPHAPSLAPAPAGQPAPLKGQQAFAPMPDQAEYGTSHISIIDAKGQAVAMTTSIESAFGARQWVGGLLLNNQLTDFSFRPADAQGRPIANRVQASKRPRSSMSPTLVFDASSGHLLGSLGSPGGSFIIHYVSKALWAMGHWRLDPQAAVAAANFGTTGDATVLEAGRFDTPTIEALSTHGPKVRQSELTSGTQILWRHGEAWRGAADPRREGRVVGVRDLAPEGATGSTHQGKALGKR